MAATGQLAGRLALITGAGSGIGRAVCELFSKEGAHVAAADISSDAVQKTVQGLQGNNHSFTVDVSSSDSVKKLVQDVHQKYSQSPCIVVNSAGITRDNFLLKLDEKAFDEVINVNLKGTFLVSQAAGQLMVANKTSNGSIINISSIVGKVGNIGQCNYAASKAGVVGFTKTAAQELARFGIRVNAILPGFIETPMTQAVPDQIVEKMKKHIPLGHMGSPENIAEACLFLASTRSSYVTGECIEVTGGLFM